MFGRNLIGLVADIKLLELDADIVKRAVADLDREIFEGIRDNRLHNASQIKTEVLNKLNPIQRNRVLQNIVGRYYEHEKSQHQYKVIEDSSNDNVLRLVSEVISEKYLHIDRPK